MFLVTAAVASSVCVHRKPYIGWVDTNVPAPDAQLVKIKISMRRDQQALEAAKAFTLARADPAHPQFREWATRSQSASANAPTPAARAAVTAWLAPHVDNVKIQGHVASFKVTVARARALLSAHFTIVRANATKQVKVAARSYCLPAAVAPHVAAVFGVFGLPLPPRKSVLKKLDDTMVGPAELIRTYQVNVNRGSGNVANRQAVAEFQGQYIQQSDITAFFQNLVPNMQSGDDQLYKTIGQQGSGDGVEALLDVEYIMGVAPGVKTEFWSFQDMDFCADLKTFTEKMLNDPEDQPNAISISYGWQGDVSAIGCTDSEVQDIDNDWMLLAQKGVSIIFASGDSGSGYDGSALWPSWPASSPWVTAVGSTCYTNGLGSAEQATTQFGSGSGFSSMFPQPDYQQKFVQRYLATASGLPPSSYFNASGRATADVSMHGENFKVYVDGSVEGVGGTSASAPLFAGLVSLVNDKLIGAGKKPLGFLNPFIYANPGAFIDITRGSDKIGRDGSDLDYGFQTAPGWDPPTGLGTMNFRAFLSAAQKSSK